MKCWTKQTRNKIKVIAYSIVIYCYGARNETSNWFCNIFCCVWNYPVNGITKHLHRVVCCSGLYVTRIQSFLLLNANKKRDDINHLVLLSCSKILSTFNFAGFQTRSTYVHFLCISVFCFNSYRFYI